VLQCLIFSVQVSAAASSHRSFVVLLLGCTSPTPTAAGPAALGRFSPCAPAAPGHVQRLSDLVKLESTEQGRSSSSSSRRRRRRKAATAQGSSSRQDGGSGRHGKFGETHTKDQSKFIYGDLKTIDAETSVF
jgi:hypothetical protein